MQIGDLAVYIFSYNRPSFLKNCVESVRRCIVGATITIVDDDSTDAAVAAYILSLGDAVRELPAPQLAAGEPKTGGLYANMNAARKDARERGFTYALFVQDDMQFVRRISQHDLENFDRYFATNETAVELDLCFSKRQFARQDELYSFLDDSRSARFRDERHPGVIGITDIGIYHLERLDRLFGDFELGEVRNQRKAMRLGVRVGYYVYPAVMWLPFPESYRGKTKGWYLRIIEWCGRVGYYPYCMMSDSKVAALMSRNVASLPIGEDWLDCPRVPRAPRWSYTGGLDNVRARGGVYALASILLGKIESVRRQ